jgi:hypothetical protein
MSRGCPKRPPRGAKWRSPSTTAPSPEVTPRVLDLLDAHGQRATFFCIAERVLAQPALAREIVARGHSIQNHTARHRHNFSFLGPRGFAAEIARAQDMLSDVTGQRPTCFRAPAGLRNPFLEPVLHRLGLSLVSWTRRGFDTREGDAAKVMARLARNLRARDILLLHDGNAARTAEGQPVLLEVLPLVARTPARRWTARRDPARRNEAMTTAMLAAPAASPTDKAWRELHEAATRSLQEGRHVRLALRARQARARPGVSRPARTRPDRRAAPPRGRHRLRAGAFREPARGSMSAMQRRGEWPSSGRRRPPPPTTRASS